MGTVFSFDVRDAHGPRFPAALDDAVAHLHRVDRVFSTYRADSQISRLARGECGLDACDPEVLDVLLRCEEAERRSGGWFSGRYAGGTGGVDPTGLVKGWAVECVSRSLAAAGAGAVCVNGGGDVQLLGGPWRVGVADPLSPGRLAVVIQAEGELAVATSGPAERGCHVLDPRTGAPPVHAMASVTVVGRSLTDVDAWATAAYAMGARARDWLEGLPDTEAFAVTASGQRWSTTGFGRYTRAATTG